MRPLSMSSHYNSDDISHPTICAYWIFWILIYIKTRKICISIAINLKSSCWYEYHPLYPGTLKVSEYELHRFLIIWFIILSKTWKMMYRKGNIWSRVGYQTEKNTNNWGIRPISLWIITICIRSQVCYRLSWG